MTKEEATLDVMRLLDELGKKAAREIMMKVFAHHLEPDAMQELVDIETNRLTDFLMEHPAVFSDVKTVAHLFMASLVAEGKRIAQTATWEGGSA